MCRKLGFFFNWTLLIIKMFLVMMVNWCAHFFVSGTHFEVSGGPWRLQKSLKTVGSQIAFQANPSGLNIGWTWLIIVFHIQGVSLGLLDQSEMSMGGPRTAWNQLYWPKWYFLAKGHPSNPNWVEKCLNMVEYCQTHPGGSLGNPRTAQKWPFGLKMAFFDYRRNQKL